MENIFATIGTFVVEYKVAIWFWMITWAFLIEVITNFRLLKALKESRKARKNVMLSNERKAETISNQMWIIDELRNALVKKEWEILDILETLEEVRHFSKRKDLKISKQKKIILEFECASLFVEDSSFWKDHLKNLAMFRKCTIEQLENEKNSWQWAKSVKTQKTCKKAKSE